MRVAVTAEGPDLDARFVPVFGRCPAVVFVDIDTFAYEGFQNDAMSSAGGAGIQFSQFVVGKGAGAIITGNIGPNAYQVLSAANLPIFVFGGGTVRQAVEAFRAGQLSQVSAPTSPAHNGMGWGGGGGMGRGGMGRGGGGRGR
jgi:predicted Fe-Mo cluster-binding NifX family protein